MNHGSLILHPIYPDPARNQAFMHHAACLPFLEIWTDFYRQVGFKPPWIGYFAADAGGVFVGTCAFKGPPKAGVVEIAYGTFSEYEGKGVGTRMCYEVVEIAKAQRPQPTIRARTLPSENASTSILRKNGFGLLGNVEDPEDGTVWEWEYRGA